MPTARCGACGAIAVGARVPCADPKPPQIRKKIAQAREAGSALRAQPKVSSYGVKNGDYANNENIEEECVTL